MIQHPKYPKIPRLEKLLWSITEKIDGTNGIIQITPRISCPPELGVAVAHVSFPTETWDRHYAILAGSRSRWLQPGKTTDNYGFAAWVQENAEQLVHLLGEGTHYGEWWGKGIQRGYDQQEKRFSLFSPWVYPDIPEAGHPDAGGCIISKVPLLDTWAGMVPNFAVENTVSRLRRGGSCAAPDFSNPEGLVLTIGNQNHKVIINYGDKSQSRDGA